ncbi:MAG: twin-arginine translocation system component TatB [Pseudomonadota bacterium]|jgi:sec-independent protein translocase protein TatB
MFGIGFTELLLIAIIAVLFLGPDKLPETMVEIARFIKGVKKTIIDAKTSLEEEMKIADLKEEALSYKKQLDEATNELQNFKNISFDEFNESEEKSKKISTEDNEEIKATPVEPKNDTVTFKKPKKDKQSKGDA